MKRLLFALLLLATPALAQDTGLLQVATCTSIANPVTNKTWCLQQSDGNLYVWNGSQWQEVGPGTGSGSTGTPYSAAGQWYIPPGPIFVNAKCDGVTDDYAVINAAITAAAYHQTVVLPSGVCIISNTLTITDTTANPKAITLAGAGMRQTYLYHTGAQTTGAIVFSSPGTWLPATSSYIAGTGGVSEVRNMAVGSLSGPAITLNFQTKPRIENVMFLSAGTSYAYLQINGSLQGRFYGLTDTGNDVYPSDVLTLLNAAGAKVLPQNYVNITSGTYNDGVDGVGYGQSLEHWFINCRGDGQQTQEAIKIVPAASGLTTGFGMVHFIGGKFTGPANVGTNYAVAKVDGASGIYFTDVHLEPQNPGGVAKTSLLVDNQLNNTDVTVISSQSESSGYLDIGTNGGASGAYLISLRVDNSQFTQLRHNYAVSPLNTLRLTNNLFGIQPSGNFPASTTTYQGQGNLILSGGVYSDMITQQIGVASTNATNFTGTNAYLTGVTFGSGTQLTTYYENTYTPSFTNLTVVNGTGGVTYSGYYTVIGRTVTFMVYITVTGTATTASTAGSTFFSLPGAPYAPVRQSTLVAANHGTSIGLGTGDVSTSAGWPPSWAAANAPITITGTYQWQ